MQENYQWLEWAKQIDATIQNGLIYTENPFDVERYEKMQKAIRKILATYSDLDLPQIENLYDDEEGYVTPKVDVRGVVFREGKVLLVEEKSVGRWTLPGGYADIGDSPSEAVAREIIEESGFEVKVVKL